MRCRPPHWPTDGLVIHDLGCGTGSMARWLAPSWPGRSGGCCTTATPSCSSSLPGPARESRTAHAVTVETRLDDITRLAPATWPAPSLITASALLDMFTEAELARFVPAPSGLPGPHHAQRRRASRAGSR